MTRHHAKPVVSALGLMAVAGVMLMVTALSAVIALQETARNNPAPCSPLTLQASPT